VSAAKQPLTPSPGVAPVSLADALVASSVDGLLTFDRECRYTLWNAAMERFTGLAAAEVLGKNAFEVFPHLLEVGVDRLFRNALAGETTVVENYEVKGRDGQRCFYDRHYSPLRDCTGAVVGGVGVVRDTTDRRVAELALHEREELFRSVVENTTDAIGIVDASGRPLYANPALTRICGCSLDELRAKTVLELVHPEDLARAAAGMMRMVTEVGSVVGLEARWRTADGSWRTLDGHSRSFFDREGNLQVVLHARDVTEAKRARESMERAELALKESHEKQRASQKLEAIGRLAGGVAHDINNLLTVVLSCADLLARTSAPRSSSQDYIAEITRASERGAALTRQLLTFSRKQPTQTRVIDLNTVVLDLQTMLKRLIGERIELVTSLGDDLHVRADPGQVEQVIVNLVLNARDALGERGGKIVIGTGALLVREPMNSVVPGKYVVLRVDDDGAGMTDEVKAHLFEPFFTTKPRGKGTGLGLATVYGIVKQSGGHVNARSNVGEGTSFEVLLPLVEGAIDASLAPLAVARPRGNETILLVEDEAPLRRLVSEVLAESGYVVVAASNGEEAIRVSDERSARGEPIDLVVTDVVMPGMSGRQLATLVRRSWPSVRVLLMSGYDDDASRGDDPVLAKPFSASVIARRVREVLDEGAP
jgi:two-component system cell cycle sensor histidine kinase/response regulator CckA